MQCHAEKQMHFAKKLTETLRLPCNGGPANGDLKTVTHLQHTPRVLRVVGHDKRHRAPIAGPQRAVAARIDRVRGRRPAQRCHLRQVAQQPSRPCAYMKWRGLCGCVCKSAKLRTCSVLRSLPELDVLSRMSWWNTFELPMFAYQECAEGASGPRA